MAFLLPDKPTDCQPPLLVCLKLAIPPVYWDHGLSLIATLYQLNRFARLPQACHSAGLSRSTYSLFLARQTLYLSQASPVCLKLAIPPVYWDHGLSLIATLYQLNRFARSPQA